MKEFELNVFDKRKSNMRVEIEIKDKSVEDVLSQSYKIRN